MNSRAEKKFLTFNISMKKVLTIVSSIIEETLKTNMFKNDIFFRLLALALENSLNCKELSFN